MYGLNNSLQIDQPSDFQREVAKDSERKRLTMTDAEKRMLEKQTARILASSRGEGAAEDEQWETPRVASTRNGLGVKDKPQFKRNRAKVIMYKPTFTILSFDIKLYLKCCLENSAGTKPTFMHEEKEGERCQETSIKAQS